MVSSMPFQDRTVPYTALQRPPRQDQPHQPGAKPPNTKLLACSDVGSTPASSNELEWSKAINAPPAVAVVAAWTAAKSANNALLNSTTSCTVLKPLIV